METSGILLGVNIDHAATVRQARYRTYPETAGRMVEPDPLAVAFLAERAGADGITVHPREDGRHIQREDVRRLRTSIQTRLNMEMAATDEMLAFALEIRPDSACIVPEKRAEITTEGGLDIASQEERLKPIIDRLNEAGIVVSLFIDAENDQIETASRLGAACIELHTGAYANAYYDAAPRERELEKLRHGAALARSLGLTVNAGHGISYVNVHPLLAIPGFHEFNIGHSIISRAVLTGMEEAVRTMKELLRRG